MDIAQLAGPTGIFSRAQAQAFGVEDVVLRRMIRSGDLSRLMRGWYAVGLPDDSWQVHRLRCLAVARDRPNSLAISHYSAAVWHGLPVDDADADTVHAMRRRGKGRRTPGLILHEPAPADPVAPGRGSEPIPAGADRAERGRPVAAGGLGGGTSQGNPFEAAPDGATPPDSRPCPPGSSGLWPARQIELAPARAGGRLPAYPYPVLVVSPALAIVQTGLVCGPLAALMAADAALHRGLVREADLRFEVARFRRVPRISQVRAALSLSDRSCESPGETRLRWVLTCLGWKFRTQVVINAEGRSYRADAELDGAPVVLEVDGAVKYAGTAEEGRRTVFSEKQREDRIRRTGREVVRFTVPELTPEIVDARIRAAIALSRRRAQPARWVG